MVETTAKNYPFLKELGIEEVNDGTFFGDKWGASGPIITSINPTNGKPIAQVRTTSAQDYERVIQTMEASKNQWMSMPFPARGDIIRLIGDKLRKHKVALGSLLSLEVGKIQSEGEGEVQEVIDVCDMACGLSRMLCGKVIPSERPEHFMMENWNPIGLMGVITAFNFPNAVFGWNFCVGAVCGNLTMWKGAPTCPLMTIATTKIVASVLAENNMPPGVLTCVVDGMDSSVGQLMVDDRRLGLISFTGSTPVGRMISQKVHARFGQCILELGGNNCTIVMPDADLELAYKGSVFAAVGTCGQRCTSLRRLLLHDTIFNDFTGKLVKAYTTIKMGDPLDKDTLQGPLHHSRQLETFTNAVKAAVSEGGKILTGGNIVQRDGGSWVQPTIIEVSIDSKVILDEYFVPILFIVRFQTLEQAIKHNNSVEQGLSSSLFTKSIQNMHKWIGPLGSDCGIVNVNIGTSGAEIGGAFGGNKATGWGRESGSDAWKQYMRRATCTINYGDSLPLAQGVKFDV